MAGRNIRIPSRGRQAKRPQPAVYSGITSTFHERNTDFLCPICFEIIEEAHMTKCGHSFCYQCIIKALDINNRCPKCNFVVDKSDQIFPNVLLNELILKEKQKQQEKRLKLDIANGPPKSELQEFLSQDCESLELHDINFMLDVLAQKKKQIEADCKEAQNQLLKEFLQEVRSHKQQQLDQLQREIRTIDDDAKQVEEVLSTHRQLHDCSMGEKNNWLNSTMAARRQRVAQHFEDLEQCYLSTRLKEFQQGDQTSAEGLEEFTDSLSKFTRYSSMRPLATLSYANDIYNGSSIVSSIEFDRDCDFFAIAGVTKKIKVFEYGIVIRDVVDMHYPVVEMLCNSKISCVSWSPYYKSTLASSDYEGTVTIWDASIGSSVKSFQEHEKRCWSVDFNRQDPQLLASGSDDAKVKLWSTNMEHSVTSLEAKANVCCVKFNPSSRFHLAFGSADHCVHYYDLRNTKQPLCVFKGHRKAVSYAKFVNSEEIVSASTDSQLKLWNVSKSNCLRTFRGHSNEKNFVGLSSDGDYVACGSENNSLYVYYKGLSKHLLTFKFDTVRSVLEKDKKEEDTNEFVSAVCWRGGSNVMVAANSQGTIKVLELV
ncbi:PREDICTED: E3 ubiquitin-protein ligase RFWD2-like isoform X2 [Priapulus caudatus]|uniref:E3 ubiquitin-protein ligase RFWD2-like isoform X2 n=1 Tax=Priapulus caudatus TaxID=37621 RepID=A0ABM1E8E2_PRICU|nr:PREDICTED: E3 ubiquitin-protein ligase RFWD2-like isoform X2 [Priapulus caudatus]